MYTSTFFLVLINFVEPQNRGEGVPMTVTDIVGGKTCSGYPPIPSTNLDKIPTIALVGSVVYAFGGGIRPSPTGTSNAWKLDMSTNAETWTQIGPMKNARYQVVVVQIEDHILHLSGNVYF